MDYLRPSIEDRQASFQQRLVFRLYSTPKRLLELIAQWLLCLRAIMELTAAGQSGIRTPVPN